MEARVRTVRDLFQSNEQYVIPFFQRSYAWKKKQRELLWSDIQRLTVDADPTSKHFLGPVVCSSVGHVPGGTKPYLLIDGQQRLTTLTIFLAALRDSSRELGEQDLVEQIHEDFLVNKRQDGPEYYKLLPRYHDVGVLKAIVESGDSKAFKNHEIHKAWRSAKRWINDSEQFTAEYLHSIFVTISERLSLVVISIDKEDPYEIFEGLNNRGIPLQESDLIRNFVFMKVEFSEQQLFNEKCWQPFESLFEDEKNNSPKVQTAFFRHYLMMEGEYSHKKATFSDFRNRYNSNEVSFEQQMPELQRLARLDRELRNPDEIEEIGIRQLIEEIHALDVVDSARSLLLFLLDSWRQENISLEQLTTSLRDLVSFALRNSICSRQTRRYDRWFPSAIKHCKEDIESGLREFLFSKVWPSDESVRNSFSNVEIYKSNRRLAHLILSRIEQSYSHKERVALDELTIEHVMPQKLSGPWEEMLGDGWFEKHQQWIHTIGNLTLTGYNSELGNKEYGIKRDNHFSNSNLRLNRYFVDHEKWTDEEIMQRGMDLTQRVIELWPRPEHDGPELDSDEGNSRSAGISTDIIREFSVRRIQDHLELELVERSPARFSDKSESTTVLCLASKSYTEKKAEGEEGYWFGFNPNQRTVLMDYKKAYLALCCGSPETVLVLPFSDFDVYLKDLNVTPDEEDSSRIRHWHIQLRRRDGTIEMQVPKKEVYVDFGKYLV